MRNYVKDFAKIEKVVDVYYEDFVYLINNQVMLTFSRYWFKLLPKYELTVYENALKEVVLLSPFCR